MDTARALFDFYKHKSASANKVLFPINKLSLLFVIIIQTSSR